MTVRWGRKEAGSVVVIHDGGGFVFPQKDGVKVHVPFERNLPLAQQGSRHGMEGIFGLSVLDTAVQFQYSPPGTEAEGFSGWVTLEGLTDCCERTNLVGVKVLAPFHGRHDNPVGVDW